jgi:hypothetical protein
VSKAEALVLPECVDAAAAAAIWAVHGSRTRASIDFARVVQIDSAGLALVLALCGAGSEASAAGSTALRAARSVAPSGLPPLPQGKPAAILLNVPDRFVQLCRAHRIEGLCT